MAALPKGSTFKPLMTCYLTDDTDPDDVERGFRDGVFTGVKLYPANATTNSAAGVTDYSKIMRVLERMEKIGMPFLMHGEDVDPDDRHFRPRGGVHRAATCRNGCKQFPGPAHHPGASVVERRRRFRARAPRRRSAAPSRPIIMMLTRTDWLGHGLKPYMYCMPVIKTAQRPRRAAQGRDLGRGLLFPRHRFRAASDARKKLVDQRRPRHVQCAGRDRDLCQGVRGGRRARQARSVCLAQRPEALPAAAERGARSRWKRRRGPRRRRSRSPGPDERALVYRGGETIEWKVVE